MAVPKRRPAPPACNDRTAEAESAIAAHGLHSPEARRALRRPCDTCGDPACDTVAELQRVGIRALRAASPAA